MVNSEMLLKRIKERGETQHSIAEKMGFSQCTLSLKINNKRRFFLAEAYILARILNITEEEFSNFFDLRVA